MDELQNIQSKIYVIRGQRVMFDFDLAKIYQVETKYLKRQVRRNIERFEGDDFMFEVSPDEILRCQKVTSSWGGSRYDAFAFTEIGVSMLSSVLNSKVAIQAQGRRRLTSKSVTISKISMRSGIHSPSAISQCVGHFLNV